MTSIALWIGNGNGNRKSLHSNVMTQGKTWAIFWVFWGYTTYGGKKTTRQRTLQNNFGPLQRASGVPSLGFLYRTNRAMTPGGGEAYQTKRGPKPVLGRGVLCEVFLPILFPPHGVLRWVLLVLTVLVFWSRWCWCPDSQLHPATSFLQRS